MNGDLLHILHVEDDDADAFLLSVALMKSGLPIHIDSARQGQAALEHLTRCRSVPDLILLDLKMSAMTGFELLSWLKRQPRLASVPAIIVSSSELPRDKAKALELGATDYVGKTADFGEVVKAVTKVLRGGTDATG
jgi:DNA-binding response OmpR family regulator